MNEKIVCKTGLNNRHMSQILKPFEQEVLNICLLKSALSSPGLSGSILTVKPTLFEAQVRDFVDGGALTVHEGIELIQEELLFGVREPAALASSLHAAHHVLLGAGRDKG